MEGERGRDGGRGRGREGGRERESLITLPESPYTIVSVFYSCVGVNDCKTYILLHVVIVFFLQVVIVF